MKLSEIISMLESEAPLAYQENYDNSGLAVGDINMEITGALLCIDPVIEVIDEAIRMDVNLVISHHPLIFDKLKRVSGETIVEKIIIKAIKNNIALYSLHTNIDNIFNGVNKKIAEKIGLTKLKILSPFTTELRKLVTYVPKSHADEVRNALFQAGAGFIGKYDSCSYNIEGMGSFRALEGSSPFSGNIGELHFENEIRIETVFPNEIKRKVLDALRRAHPYEEIAFDIFHLDNVFDGAGSGMIGELEGSEDEISFLNKIKKIFNSGIIRHTKPLNKPVKRIALCGGSGGFLIQKAISSDADIFLTGEIKYHQFFEANNKILIVDIGHYESEKFTIEIFYDILRKKLSNFAIHFSTINTNPIYYI